MVSPSGHPPLPISTLMVILPFSIASFHPMFSSSKATNIMKPCPMDCCTLSGQLCLINMLSTYILGSGGNSLYLTETVKKKANFQLMLPEWQLKFTNSGHELDDNPYSYDCLVQLMVNHQLFCNTTIDAHNHTWNLQQGNHNVYTCGGPAGHAPPFQHSPFHCSGPPLHQYYHYNPPQGCINTPFSNQHTCGPTRGGP